MVKLLGRSAGLLGALLLYGLTGTSQAQVVLYDAFPGPLIDPAKWFAPSDQLSAEEAPNLEISRVIVSGRLQMGLTTHGATDNNTEASGVGRHGIRIIDPSGITAMQVDMIVNGGFTVQGCAANPTPSESSIQMVGTFFNDGTVGGTGRTGDIIATFGLTRRSSGAPLQRIEATVYRCQNGCFIPAAVVATETFTTTWAAAAVKTLRMEWLPASKEFRFTVSPGVVGEEVRTIPYTFDDSTPLKGTDYKSLRLENIVADCTAGRRRASFTGRFDNMSLNP